MRDYTDRNVLITGASSGLGAEFARQLHARGARLLLIARRKDVLDEMTAKFNGLRPGSARALSADLSSPGELRDLCDYAARDTIDVLVNNAGFGSFGGFSGLDISREQQMIRVNVEAPVLLAHAVIPQMKHRGSGAIITLSSVAAFQPIPGMATYAATKAFGFSHSLALRAELKPFGIDVLAVCPGPTETGFGRAASVPQDLMKTADRAADVVRAALAALEQRRAYVVTGMRAKAIAWFSRLMPVEWSTALIAGRTTSGG